MSQMIEYVRKQGNIIGYFINEDSEVSPIYAKGEPYGCFYARKVCDELGMYRIAVGWSLCNKKDSFSKSEAVSLAKVRACSKMDTNIVIPHSIKNKFIAFCERAKLYYRLNNFTNTYSIVKEEKINV